MRIRADKITKNGAAIPTTIQVQRVPIDTVLQHQIQDLDIRNRWCTQGLTCSKYGKRPCCPPQVKLFHQLKPRDRFYLISVQIKLDDYYTVYPNVRESKSWMYFGMVGTHKMTKLIANKIASAFPGQAFRVGGCLGCTWPKNGKCKRFMPALEATGINVVALTQEVFGYEIEWYQPKQPMKVMSAIGAIYTNEPIQKIDFKEAIFNELNRMA